MADQTETPLIEDNWGASPLRLAASPGGEGFHDLEGALEGDAARVEVGLEEELGQAGLGVAAHILADLAERAPERPALLALRARVEVKAAARHDPERRRVPAPLLVPR